METARNWIARVSGGDSVNAVAGKADVKQSTLDRQIKSNFPPETAVKIARAYGYSPVQGLVDLGLITAAEARDSAGLEALNLDDALSRAGNDDLLREIGKRLQQQKAEDELDRRRARRVRPEQEVSDPEGILVANTDTAPPMPHEDEHP